MIELLRRCSDILEPHELVMVLEPLNWYANHGGTFLQGSPQAYAISKAVNSPSCKILFDIYHQQISEGVEDARDVVVAATNASVFAYVADGDAGLKVLQLTSPKSQPGYYGFSPEPKPELIAHYPTRRELLSLSRGLERDRAVDESGHQVSVFSRVGSGPLTVEDMQGLYLDDDGKPWFVADDPQADQEMESEK